MAKRSLWATPQITFTCLIPRMTQHENLKSLLQKREGKRQVIKMTSFHVLCFLTCSTQEIPSVVFSFNLKIMLLVVDWGVWQVDCHQNGVFLIHIYYVFICNVLPLWFSLLSGFLLLEMRRYLPEPCVIRPARVSGHSMFSYFSCHKNHIPWNQMLILLGKSYHFMTDMREYKIFRSRRWATVTEQY